jgi:metallophosphoesterase superfamily enzyme
MTTVMAIGDTQFPFTHQDVIAFLTAVYKKYKPNHVVQIGDLFDQYFANAWGKTTAAKDTEEEFRLALEVLHEEFLPIFGKTKVSIIIGNHDERLHKRADEAGIHSMFVKSLRDIYQLPSSIYLGYELVIDGVTYLHGHQTKCTADTADKILTDENETPVVYGHFHSKAGIRYLANKRRLVWGFNLGCLIDRYAYAFQYGRAYKDKPILGCGIIIDGLPFFVPMVLTAEHRWVGKL